MKRISTLFWFIIILFLCREISAQEPFRLLPKLDSMSASYFNNKLDSINFPQFHHIDTVLSGIEKGNVSKRDFYTDLGNLGQAQKSLLFGIKQNSDFLYKDIPYYSFMRNAENPRFYRSIQPYSEIYYHMGAKTEQVVSVKFSSNIYQGLTLGLEYDIFDAPGSYLNSETANNTTNLNLRYFSPDYRYGVIARYFRYKIFAEENGGIQADSIFEQQTETVRVTPVNLSTGSTTIRNWGFEVSQFFNITKPDFKKKEIPQRPPMDKHTMDSLKLFADTLRLFTDSLYFDSLMSFEIKPHKKPFNFGRISLDLKYRNFYWIYENESPSLDYYKNIYNDSTYTFDSINQHSFVADFGYSNVNINQQEADNQLIFYTFLKYSYNQVKNGDRFFANHQLIPRGEIVTKLFKTFELRASGEYSLSGYNQNDAVLTASMSNYFLQKSLPSKVWVEATYASQMPEWFYNYYSGNHFQWSNNLDKTSSVCLGGGIENRWFTLTGHYFIVDKYTFLNENIVPEQADKTQNVLRIAAKSKIKLGKFTLDNNIAYQESFNSSVINLPTFIYSGTYYFEVYLFKKALLLQPGISLFYNTLYYADAYQPAVNSFYLQSEKEVGNYLYGDLFINFNIKRARLFVKYSHINQGLFPYTYYMVPHYPQPNGGFYFGVSWRLFG